MSAAADLDTDYELVHADPHDLVIGPNVRRDPEYRELVLSVAARGVVAAITAHWDDGLLVVIDGQRRTLAACEAGVDTVPVYVVEKPGDADRIVDQLTANTHRQDLDVADTAAAYEQLTVAGMGPDEIATLAAVRREQVDAGLAIARSPVAVGTVRKYPQTTFDQGVAIAEFEADKDAVGRLVKVIDEHDGYGFDHELQRIRNDRAEAAALTALERELADAGVALVNDLPYSTYGKAAQLTELKDGGKNLTATRHQDCPGHAAYVQRRYNHSGPDTFEAVYLCRDWKKHGHVERGAAGRSASRTATASGSGGMTEAEKAERRRVVEGNKAWRAATEVRRRWLVDLVQRKQLDGAERFIADAVLAGETLGNACGSGHQFYLRLVDGQDPEQLAKAIDDTEYVEVGSPRAVRRGKVADEIATAKPARALAITAGMILAAWERWAADPQTWRRDRSGYHGGTASRYLAAMATWGYQLAPIEHALVDGVDWQPEAAGA